MAKEDNTSLSVIVGGKSPHDFVQKKGTLNDRENGIFWETFPKTFRDAITITRKLGIQYLWIDCLCIIQDEKRDWEVESAKMASIYESAYVTISATRSTNSDDGIFDQREETHLIHRESDGIYKLALSVVDYEQDYPVMSRGWCFQERLLSARVIHYAQHELVYECGLSAWCECDMMIHPTKLLKAQWVEALLLTDTKPLLKFWRNLVQHYCAKYLSYSDDQLVALSGVAHRFHKPNMLGRYVAGLWETNLAYNLLWISEDFDGKRPSSRPSGREGVGSAYLAPTFSWASRVGPIKWFTEEAEVRREEDPARFFCIGADAKQRVEILELQCFLSEANTYGKVTGGFLKATGPLISGRIEGERKKNYLRIGCKIKTWGLDISFFADSIEDTMVCSGRVVHFLLLFSTEEASYGLVLQKVSLPITRAYQQPFGSFPNIFTRSRVFSLGKTKVFDNATTKEVIIV